MLLTICRKQFLIVSEPFLQIVLYCNLYCDTFIVDVVIHIHINSIKKEQVSEPTCKFVHMLNHIHNGINPNLKCYSADHSLLKSVRQEVLVENFTRVLC